MFASRIVEKQRLINEITLIKADYGKRRPTEILPVTFKEDEVFMLD